FAILFSSAVSAQKYSTARPAAIRNFEEAKSRYNLREDEKALQFLAKAIEEDSLFIEAYLLRANIHTDMKQPEKAITDYRTAVRIAPDFFPNTFYTLGRLEFLTQQYESSYEHLSTYIALPKANPTMVSNARKIMASCMFAKTAVLNPVRFEPENLGPGVNTVAQEYFPAITADGSTFLFTRRIKSGGNGQRVMDQEDFYVSRKTSGAWQEAAPVVEINTKGNEGAPSLSA
ncbi:MAG: tetratricopeptide repeat protein, partial [Flavobacteriales bacterium]